MIDSLGSLYEGLRLTIAAGSVYVTVEAVAWLIPFFIAFLWISWQMLKEWRDGRPVKTKWVVMLVCVSLLVRLPSLLANRAPNIDEAQTLAHALTLIRFPVPWQGVDFTTNGPLNTYVFYLSYWLGGAVDYLSSHVILLVLEVLLCLAIFITARNWMGRQAAVMTMLPLLVFMAFAQRGDFIHQASEFWCVTALSGALAIFSGITTEKRKFSVSRWFWVGVLLGMVPFGKPQGVPPALVAVVFMYIWIFTRKKGKDRRAALGMLSLGGVAIPAVFALGVFFAGAWTDFLDLFIRANLHYAAAHGEGLAIVPTFFWSWGFYSGVSIFSILTVFLLLLVAVWSTPVSPHHRRVGWMFAAVTLGGVYAVERAGRPFDHYLLLFVFPGLVLLTGWALEFMRKSRRRAILVFSGFFILSGYFLLKSLRDLNPVFLAFREGKPWVLRSSSVSDFVRQWATEEQDCISVYGYYNDIYVETQLPSATRLVTVYQHSAIWPELYTPYYYRDLVENRPVVLIDALDTPQDFRQSFVNRRDHSPEKIPELKRFMDENYQLVEVIDRSRVYVRNDRLGAKNKRKP